MKLLLALSLLAAPIGARQFTVPVAPGQAVITAGPELPISALAFRPGAPTLAVGGYQEILVWDLQNATFDKRIGIGDIKGQVRSLAFHKDGRWLAVAEGIPGSYGAVRLLDFATGRVVATLFEARDEMLVLTFSADGKWLAAGGVDAMVRVWTVEDRKLVTELKGHTDWISGLAFSPNGKLLASGSTDKTVQVWNTAEWRSEVSLPQTVTEPVSGVAFSPDGTMLTFAVGGPEERAIRIWRPEVLEQAAANVQRKPNTKFTRPSDTGTCLAMGVVWAPNGRPRYYTPCTDKSVRVFNNSGGYLAGLNGHQDWVYAVAISPDGAKVATSSGDGTVRIWSGADNILLATLIQLRPRTDDWLILTPKGNFAASTPAAIELKAKDGKRLTDDQRSALQNTQAVKDTIVNRPPPPKPAAPPAPKVSTPTVSK